MWYHRFLWLVLAWLYGQRACLLTRNTIGQKTLQNKPTFEICALVLWENQNYKENVLPQFSMKYFDTALWVDRWLVFCT